VPPFGLAYQGKQDIVFRFTIEYSSLRNFYRPLGNRSILIQGLLEKMIFRLVLKLEISYRVIIFLFWILDSFRRFFEDYIFAW
jgi:hypothetical protein